MIFIVFNGTFNGFDSLILLKSSKTISTYKQRKFPIKSIVEQFLKKLKNNEKSMRNYSGMHPLQ
jgi:hypothetical protein